MNHHDRNLARPATAIVTELIAYFVSAPTDGEEQEPAALLNRLEEGVQTYELAYRGFLNSQAGKPPLALGAVLTTAFDELAADRARHLRSFGFRLEAVEARFRAADRLVRRRIARAERGEIPPRFAAAR